MIRPVISTELVPGGVSGDKLMIEDLGFGLVVSLGLSAMMIFLANRKWDASTLHHAMISLKLSFVVDCDEMPTEAHALGAQLAVVDHSGQNDYKDCGLE